MPEEHGPCLEDALRGSQSGDYRERAVAGVKLARWADDPDVAARLQELILDADDTFVTLKTTTALIERRDRCALRILATALPAADDQQEGWIEAGIDDGLNGSEEARQRCLSVIADLLQDPDSEVQEGAQVLAGLVRSAGLV